MKADNLIKNEKHIDPFGLKLKRPTPTIGLYIKDFDLRAPKSPELCAHLKHLLVEHKVLFFRDQKLTNEEFVEVSQIFGENRIFPFTTGKRKHSFIEQIYTNSEKPPHLNIWHSDNTWRKSPAFATLAYGKIIPECGGDTLFADMEAAYEGLEDEMKIKLDKVMGVHSARYFLEGMRERGESEEVIQALSKKYPDVFHPVIRKHPISRAKGDFCKQRIYRGNPWDDRRN